MEPEGHEVALRTLHRAAIRVLAPADDRAAIIADLDEEAAQIAAMRGARAARTFIRWQIAHSAGPWIRRRARERAQRAARSIKVMHRGVWSDVRLAVRRLRQAPGFTSLAIVTLAISIGAVAAAFSLAHALWLKPLPYQDPDRLIFLHAKHALSGTFSSFTAGETQALASGSKTLSDLAVFNYGSRVTRVGDEPTRIVTYHVTSNLFGTLGVRPLMGRDFTMEDAVHSRVAIITWDFWNRRFGRDQAILGKTLPTVGGAEPLEIVGVMPRGFVFPRGLEPDAWVPWRPVGTGRTLQAIARLAPGVSAAEAEAEAGRIVNHASQVPGGKPSEWSALSTPAGVKASASARLAYQVLLALVSLFLLIACANLAGLVIARNLARRAELAVCLSLGASRWRLVRALAIESLLLAGAGCAVGVGVAWAGARTLAVLMPKRTPGIGDVRIDITVLAVMSVVALVAAACIGLLPALGLRSMRPAEAFAGARTSSRRAGSQRALVLVEIALAVVLLVGAGSMLRSFSAAIGRDRGYDPNGLHALNVSMPFAEQNMRETAQRARAFDAMVERIAQIPGVTRAAATTGFPGSAAGLLGMVRVTPVAGQRPVMAPLHSATPGYFDTMGTPILAGRDFRPSDSTGAAGVAIVNQQLARLYPGRNPIGQQIVMEVLGDEPKTFEVVGVAGDIKLMERIGPRIFVPLSQGAPYWVDLVYRANGTAPADVHRALRALGPDYIIENASSFQSIISDSLGLERAQSSFAGMLGALAAIVAGIGIYALMTYLAAQRRREMGIRLALGSSPARLFREAFASALRLVVAGVALGLGAAWLTVRAVRTQVFGLTTADATTYAVAAGLVLLVSIAAVWLPARRVMRTDPLVALKAE